MRKNQVREQNTNAGGARCADELNAGCYARGARFIDSADALRVLCAA